MGLTEQEIQNDYWQTTRQGSISDSESVELTGYPVVFYRTERQGQVHRNLFNSGHEETVALGPAPFIKRKAYLEGEI